MLRADSHVSCKLRFVQIYTNRGSSDLNELDVLSTIFCAGGGNGEEKVGGNRLVEVCTFNPFDNPARPETPQVVSASIT